jgi:hypothetical protein
MWVSTNRLLSKNPWLVNQKDQPTPSQLVAMTAGLKGFYPTGNAAFIGQEPHHGLSLIHI